MGGVLDAALDGSVWLPTLEEVVSDNSPLLLLKASKGTARRSNSSMARLRTPSVIGADASSSETSAGAAAVSSCFF